jgi:hypothetical protein
LRPRTVLVPGQPMGREQVIHSLRLRPQVRRCLRHREVGTDRRRLRLNLSSRLRGNRGDHVGREHEGDRQTPRDSRPPGLVGREATPPPHRLRPPPRRPKPPTRYHPLNRSGGSRLRTTPPGPGLTRVGRVGQLPALDPRRASWGRRRGLEAVVCGESSTDGALAGGDAEGDLGDRRRLVLSEPGLHLRGEVPVHRRACPRRTFSQWHAWQ